MVDTWPRVLYAMSLERKRSFFTLVERWQCLGITVVFTVSNASEVQAEPTEKSSCEPNQPQTNVVGFLAPLLGAQASNASGRFDIVAKFVRKDRVWRVIRSTITPSGERAFASRAHSRRTAYRVVDLARHVAGLIRVEPHAQGSAIRASLDGYVREVRAIEGNMLSRIRQEAAKNAFCTPDENCEYLPVLKAKKESRGHKMELSTFSSAEMRAVLIGVGRDEHVRLRKKAIAIPVSRGTDTNRAELIKWSNGAKEGWLEKTQRC